MRKVFKAGVFNLCEEDECAEYEKIMQSVTDEDGKFELASDPNRNWDKSGGHSVAVDYYEFEE